MNGNATNSPARYSITAVACFALFGCGLERRANYQDDVEVALNISLDKIDLVLVAFQFQAVLEGFHGGFITIAHLAWL